jgi:hypothetical protein
MVNAQSAELAQELHPLRLQYQLLADANPMMAPVATLAEHVRRDRRPAAVDNPFVAMQEKVSRQIVTMLDAWREMTEAVSERTFLAIYGLPTLQAAVGIDPAATGQLRKAARTPLHQELIRKRTEELRSQIPVGGLREAVIRGLLHAGMKRAALDERSFELARRIRQSYGEMPLSEFKALVREQFYMLLMDEEAALAAIPSMLPDDSEKRQEAFDVIKRVWAARGEASPEDEKRLGEVARLFGVAEGGGAVPIHFRRRKGRATAKAS